MNIRCDVSSEYVSAIKYLMEKYNVSFLNVENILPQDWEFPIIVEYDKVLKEGYNKEMYHIGWFNVNVENVNNVLMKNIIRENKIKRILKDE